MAEKAHEPEYKLRIFETIYPKDKIVGIDDILEEVEYIYNKMILGNNE